MSSDLIASVTNASMALITFLSGCLIAATPWLTRGREAFAVSVPETAQADPRIRRMRRVFSRASSPSRPRPPSPS